ncbi:MAG: hypothetical protein LBS24_01470, partial [Clostridiales Family XIII bacterium]|nr:hypothetical protein [Clostridiales Family XIII bacterium]
MNSADMQTTLETSEIPAATDRPATKDALAFTGADKALIPGMLACGFFYWEWILFGGQTALGVSLFILLLCGVTLLYFGKRGVKQGRASLLCLAVLCLSCVQFAVFDTT